MLESPFAPAIFSVASAAARHTPVQSGCIGAEAAWEIPRQAGVTNASTYEHDELLDINRLKICRLLAEGEGTE